MDFPDKPKVLGRNFTPNRNQCLPRQLEGPLGSDHFFNYAYRFWDKHALDAHLADRRNKVSTSIVRSLTPQTPLRVASEYFQQDMTRSDGTHSFHHCDGLLHGPSFIHLPFIIALRAYPLSLFVSALFQDL